MVLLRTAALRRPIAQHISGGVRRSARAAGRPSWQQLAGRRGYADAKGATKDAGSDLPWAIGAVVVTIPSLYYLLQPKSDDHGAAGHGDHGAADTGHHEEKTEAEPEPAKEEASEDEKKSDDSSDKQGDAEQSSDDESKEAPKEESEGEQKDAEAEDKEANADNTRTTQETAESSKSGDVAFKGPGKKVEGDERKKEPSPKSDTGEKKRIDSALRKPQGVAGDESKISKQQDKISNAPTMHSTDQVNNPDQSKKPEGAPDTAKLPHPVDPKR